VGATRDFPLVPTKDFPLEGRADEHPHLFVRPQSFFGDGIAGSGKNLFFFFTLSLPFGSWPIPDRNPDLDPRLNSRIRTASKEKGRVKEKAIGDA